MKTKSVLIAGEQIRYVDEGTGASLIFVHGWSVTPATYEKTIEGLAESFHVYAPFLRESSDWVLTLKYFIEALNIEKPFILGHSLSGIPVVLFAYRYPQKTSGIILVDSMGVVGAGPIGTVVLWFTHVAHFFGSSQNHSPGFAIKLVWDFLFQTIRYPFRVGREAKVALRSDISYFLKNITVPLLILWGKDDDLTPLWEGYTMKLKNKYAQFDVLPGGHDWIKIKPFLLAERVIQFVKEEADERN